MHYAALLTRLMALLFVVILGALSAAGIAAAGSEVPVLPMEPDDAPEVVLNFRRAANLVLPDLRTLPPRDVELEYVQDLGRVRLRFANTIWNSGHGDLELHGTLIPGYDSVLVTQVVEGDQGQLHEERSGVFAYHEEHGHWHWEGFSIYQVWSVDLHGRPQEVVASSDKVGYCLIDVRLYPGVDTSVRKSRQYGDCNWYLQGLSSGWTDTYQAHIAGQFVDITHLSDGTYVLISTVDPEDRILETDNRNNSTHLYFTLAAGEILVTGDRFMPADDSLSLR